MRILFCLLLVSISSFSQVNDYYDVFTDKESEWQIELSYDKIEKVKFGSFESSVGDKFRGVISDNNRIRYGIIEQSTRFDTLYYYGLFNGNQFIGVRYSKKFDNFYKGIWVENKMTANFYNSTTKSYQQPKNITGKYIVFYNKGAFYYGNMVDGKREGDGIYLSKSGYIYYGLWKEDRRIGRGSSSIFANGDGFRGSYVKDKVLGYGAYYKRNDTIIENDWKQKRKGIYNGNLLQLKKSSIQDKLENKFAHYWEYNVEITDDLNLDNYSDSEKEKDSPVLRKPNIKKTEISSIPFEFLNSKNDQLKLIEEEKSMPKKKFKAPLAQGESKSSLEKFLQILLPFVLFYFLYRLFKNSKSTRVESVSQNVKTAKKIVYKPLKEVVVKEEAPVYVNKSEDLSKGNYSETEFEMRIQEQFDKLSSSKTRIFWVGDEHRTHEWSKMRGGSTVVVLYKNEKACRGYDKVKRPDAYTKKISRDYIANNFSDSKSYDLESYISEIYLAKHSSRILKKVWHSNLNMSPWEILEKYRIK